MPLGLQAMLDYNPILPARNTPNRLYRNFRWGKNWITTDVHFAEVFRYTPFVDDPDFQVHEVVVGPLNAGVLGKPDFDTTLGTQSLFRSINAPTTWAEAKQAFNFRLVRITSSGALTVSITGINGASFFDLLLTPR